MYHKLLTSVLCGVVWCGVVSCVVWCGAWCVVRGAWCAVRAVCCVPCAVVRLVCGGGGWCDVVVGDVMCGGGCDVVWCSGCGVAWHGVVLCGERVHVNMQCSVVWLRERGGRGRTAKMQNLHQGVKKKHMAVKSRRLIRGHGPAIYNS